MIGLLRALSPAVAFLAGILIADFLVPSVAAAAAAGVVSILALAAAWLVHRRRGEPTITERLPRLGLAAGILLLIGSGGIGFSDLGLRIAALDRARLPDLAGRVVGIEGSVISDPRQSGRSESFRVQAHQLEQLSARELLEVRLYGDKLPSLGDKVSFDAKITALEPTESYDRGLYRKGVVAKGTVLGAVEVIGRGGNPLVSSANALRERMQSMALEKLDEVPAGLVLGLTIGDDRLLGDEGREIFRTTSLAHLTAVSGTNVAMVLGAVLLTLRAVGVSRRAQVGAGALAVVFFAVVTRWEPSVMRATLMALAGLAAFWFGRRYEPLHAIALVFILLLGFNPLLLWSIGFQLSFVASLGILLITPVLLERFRRLPKPLAEALAVGIGAQAAVTPLLALHFSRVSAVSIPANLAAFPLVAPITILGLLGGLVGLVSAPAGGLLIAVAGLLARALYAIASFFSSVPNASIQVDGNPAFVALAYLILLAIVLWLVGKRRTARWPAVIALSVAFVALGAVGGRPDPPTDLRITFVDVGQGDATLIEAPDGGRILIDGGPNEQFLSSELKRRRIKRLDLVVFSHPHLDHINGLPGVLTASQSRLVVDAGVPNPWAERIGVAHKPQAVQAGLGLRLGGLEVEFLGPSKEAVSLVGETLDGRSGEGSAVNDASVVMRIGWGQACALFPGDIEEAGQTEVVANYANRVSCAVLKAPHHGSPKLREEFVRQVDPEWVAVSVGPNSYGHPSVSAIRTYEASGGRVLRTDREGDIVLEMSRSGAVVRPR